MDLHLTRAVKTSQAITIAAGAAGATGVNGATLDMSGFGGVRAVVLFGPIVAGAATSLKWQQDTDSGMGTAEDVEGSAQTVADSNDNTVFISDLIRPTKRYVRLVVSRATQNATVAAVYEQYNADNNPVTQHADVTINEIFKDAVGGTA